MSPGLAVGAAARRQVWNGEQEEIPKPQPGDLLNYLSISGPVAIEVTETSQEKQLGHQFTAPARQAIAFGAALAPPPPGYLKLDLDCVAKCSGGFQSRIS
jgi:hypothetical protein